MFKLDWMTATDPVEMLEQLFPVRGLDSVEPQSRQSRFYLHACARRAWDRLPEVCRVLVAISERVYHQRTPDRALQKAMYPHAEELVNCRGDAARINALGRELVRLGHAPIALVRIEEDLDPDTWTGFAHLAFFPFYKNTPHYRSIPSDLHSVELLREVFGNPFERKPSLDPAWFTQSVMSLAKCVDSTGDFSALPVLADALEEAGCDREDVLEHFRSVGPHVRGCWALELILG